jgi:predicted deacylase
MFQSRSLWFLFLALIIIQSCKSSKEFSGFSYDPEGATETITKQIEPQYKHTIGIASDGVWLSNEFKGARLNNFYKANDTLYQAVIEPENSPINNSPWYAFKAWAAVDTTVWIKLSYKHGEHRYVPKLSKDGTSWKRINPQDYRLSRRDSSAFLRLSLDKTPLWVSAQELRTQQWFAQWADSMARQSFITQDTIGYSHQQRPIRRLAITEVPDDEERGVVIITGRLHPPEVTGNMAAFAFLEELASDSELAQNFRQNFEVITYPFANPDGVQNGHWRHNAGGVDLNRDWKNFNQPETQSIRDDLYSRLKNNAKAKVYYGIDFHSTDENIFYPINREVETFPDDFTYRWLDAIMADFPGINFTVEPFDTSSPITKNWIYHTFGADAVTYEVDDRADRNELEKISRRAAQLMMQQLLEVNS